MFEELFTQRKALRRHRDGPWAEARERYLSHCARKGAARSTLLRVARELLVIANRIDLGTINPESIKSAGQNWARYQRARGRTRSTRFSEKLFVQVASVWLQFLGHLEKPVREPRALDSRVAEFAAYLRDARGLSPTTIEGRCWYVQRFFDALGTRKRSPAELTVEDVDNFLSDQAKQGWCRVSVATGAKALRSFFRYAAMRRWCSPGIAEAIDAPRVFKFEGLPSGPEWDDVRRLVMSTGGSEPRDIRDRAILMLLAVYGLRSREVRTLSITDLDWRHEVITIPRPKQRLTQRYPLVCSVGDAILQYLQQVRPRCSRRELFLTVVPPFGPLSMGCMYHVVSRRIRNLGIQARHYGPHSLRHACATHLVAQGLSLKEIGDHLGHRSSESTQIYAKVNLVGLREVADFDLRGLS